MRVGIVLKLRKAFEEVGRRGIYDASRSTTKGDPTKSTLVHEYITFKHLEQGESDIILEVLQKLQTLK